MAVTLSTKCDLKHPVNKGRRTECKKIQKRIGQTCGGLRAINPNLYTSCVDYAQSGNDISQEDFMCGVVGPDVLWGQYQIARCGFNVKKDTPQGKFYKEQEEEAFFYQQLPIIFLAIILLFLLYYLVFKVIR